jgi:hypothetical protein
MMNPPELVSAIGSLPQADEKDQQSELLGFNLGPKEWRIMTNCHIFPASANVSMIYLGINAMLLLVDPRSHVHPAK